MAYVSLYRKYRPQTFDDIVGQRHVTQTLTNAIREARLHHAYLFTGPRGTGKTSTARILAKAINCEQGPTVTPCNDCDTCRAITSGASVDVIELDMASHGGVDDARELRERALFAPARARTKVYILDEVHMASTAAFNALLKLIEEPPSHVVFAMATTEPQKVLPTIMSRVQRLDLRRIGAVELAGHIRQVATREGAVIEDAAVDAIVRSGDGSARDAMSVLEQALSYAGALGNGDSPGTVTAADVAQLLGHTPAERTFEAVDRLADRDLAGILGLVQRLLDDGHDLRRFAFDLLSHLRDLLVLQVAPDRPDLVDATDEWRDRLAAQAGTLPRKTLLQAVDLLAATVTEQRQGPARLPLEIALAKLLVPATTTSADEPPRVAPAAITGPPTSDAEAAATAGPPAAAGTTETPGPAADDDATVPPEEMTAEAGPAPAAGDASEPSLPATDDATVGDAATESRREAVVGGGSAPPGDDDLAAVTKQWAAILDLVKDDSRRVHAVYEPARPVAVARGVVTLRYPTRYKSFHAANARKAGFADVLQAAILRACGLTLRVDAVVDGEERRPLPPLVTAADATTSDLEAEADDVAARETEANGVTAIDLTDAHQLLTDELGAELVDEQPAPAGDAPASEGRHQGGG